MKKIILILAVFTTVFMSCEKKQQEVDYDNITDINDLYKLADNADCTRLYYANFGGDTDLEVKNYWCDEKYVMVDIYSALTNTRIYKATYKNKLVDMSLLDLEYGDKYLIKFYTINDIKLYKK
ncbi:MAG: hypothetical protein LBV69_09875 [Bacteroidales bacterium]|jgi:hypothetical protein|nr:hypothetical protein [Bacteroidales bacterium]